MRTVLHEAEYLLSVAGTYAGDGAITTAIERAEQAINILKQERDRRAALIAPNIEKPRTRKTKAR